MRLPLVCSSSLTIRGIVCWRRYLARDSSGRLIIPTDSVDGRRSEAWRALVVAVCVFPPSLREPVERAARKVRTTAKAAMHLTHRAMCMGADCAG
jgi:hypothetical protein